MSDLNAPAAPWRAEVIQDFARSELFQRTFQEGMDLVEETAGYLDGAGRQDSKLLSRNAALAYAAESMRLTTRLMQVASWLLVQRAVREGDMPPDAACEDRYRLAGEEVCRAARRRRRRPAAASCWPCWTAPSGSTSASATSTGGCTSKADGRRARRTRCCRSSDRLKSAFGS